MSKPNRKPQPATAANKTNTLTPSASKAPRSLYPILLAGLAILLYINTLGHGFVLDDDLSIKLHASVPKGIAGWMDILTQGSRAGNFGGNLYRPFPLMLFAFEWMIAPNSPGVHHFFQVFWYAILGIAVYALMRQWMPKQSKLIPFGIAALFLAHPLHTEVVANIKSRDEIMSLLGAVAALWAWSRYLTTDNIKMLVAAMLFWFLGLMSKEGAVTLFPVFVLSALIIHNQTWAQAIRKSLPLLAPLALYLGIRAILFANSPQGLPDANDNPIVEAQGFVARSATAFGILWQYLRLLILPHPLSSDYSFNAMPLLTWSSSGAILGLLSHIGLLAVAIWGILRKNIWGLLAAAYLCAILLYSQLPLIIGTIFGERLIFTGSLFYCAALGLLLSRFFRPNAEENTLKPWPLQGAALIFMAVIGVIVVAFGLRTISRNSVWNNNLTLFQTDVQTYPNSVRLRNFAASELLRKAYSDSTATMAQRDTTLAAAEVHLKASLAIKPTPTALSDMGNLAFNRGQIPQAIEYYRQSKALFVLPEVQKNLGMALRTQAMSLGQSGKTDEARALLLEAQKETPIDAEVQYLLGVSYGTQGQAREALPYFEKAVQLNPNEARYQQAVQMAKSQIK